MKMPEAQENKGLLRRGAEFASGFNKVLGAAAVGAAVALELIGAPEAWVVGALIFGGLQFVEGAVWKKLSEVKKKRATKKKMAGLAMTGARA